MWDLPRPKKRWYRRWWFTIPFFTLLILATAGTIFVLVEKAKWEAEAKTFDYSKLDEMESASVIYDREGKVMSRMFTQNRDQVAFNMLSPYLLKAVVAAEDTRFYTHKGVDYKGIIRAMVVNYQKGRTVQGASTLTQQLARNTFPKELPPSDRSKERKIREMFVAWEIEKRCSKEKVLELYLNRVYFGAGFYGAESAAKGYFGKHAKDLTLSESCLLAAILPSPDRYSPWKNYKNCLDERNRVLNRALESNIITRAEYDTAFAEEPVIKNKKTVHQESHAADMIYQQVVKLVGREAAMGDGYRIYTTIDSALQKKAESEISSQLAAIERREGYEHPTYAQFDEVFKAAKGQPVGPDGRRLEPDYLQGASVVLDNKNGAILAMVGGRDFSHSALNRTTQAQVPPGTAFMPLVYAAAFEKGFFPGTVVQDAVMDNTKVMIGGTTGILGEWGPERMDNRYEGAISARTALVKSKNAATVRLGMMTGIQNVNKLAEEAGISSELAEYPRTYLGASEVSPMELTLAHMMFPNYGMRPTKPFIIQRIEDKTGNLLFEAKTESTRIIKPTTAYEVHSCLAEVLDHGTAERANGEMGLKRYPLGGKSGTAYNFTDVWFVGYSSEVTCSVWIGFDKQRGKSRRSIYRGAFGSDIALPVWAELMKASFDHYKPKEIQQPAGIVRCEVCSLSGGLAMEKCSQNGVRTTYQEIAAEDQVPKDICPVHSGAPVSTVGEITSDGVMKAKAVEPSSLTLVAIKEPSVIGVDPYGANQAVDRIVAIGNVGNAQAPMDSTSEIPVNDSANVPAVATPPKATVVAPAPVSDIKLDQPEPIQF